MGVVDVLMRGAQREVGNVTDFLTTTKGPFETADAIVRDARRTVREVGEQVGVRVPMFGQVRRRPRLLRDY